MFKNKKSLAILVGIFLIAGIEPVQSQGVAITIENVTLNDDNSGTFELYMANQAGCYYCSDNTYSNIVDCLEYGDIDSLGNILGTWEFSESMDTTACIAAAVNGEFFNGKVGGFQIVLSGITIDSTYGGSVEEQEMVISASDSVLLGFSMTGTNIPAGEGVLTTVKFLEATGEEICFGEDIGDTGNTLISNALGGYIVADWGSCVCPSCDGACGINNPSCLSIYQTNTNLPKEFSISQNFPNPFNPATNITFDVAEMDNISLIVYDLSGKEVITLASGIFMPGIYSVNWNAVNNYGHAIASGMYIYRYISSDKAITRKMLYLK